MVKKEVVKENKDILVDSSEDTLLTTFKNRENGDDAFMVVNYKDPYFKQNDTVTLNSYYFGIDERALPSEIEVVATDRAGNEYKINAIKKNYNLNNDTEVIAIVFMAEEDF